MMNHSPTKPKIAVVLTFCEADRLGFGRLPSLYLRMVQTPETTLSNPNRFSLWEIPLRDDESPAEGALRGAHELFWLFDAKEHGILPSELRHIETIETEDFLLEFFILWFRMEKRFLKNAESTISVPLDHISMFKETLMEPSRIILEHFEDTQDFFMQTQPFYGADAR